MNDTRKTNSTTTNTARVLVRGAPSQLPRLLTLALLAAACVLASSRSALPGQASPPASAAPVPSLENLFVTIADRTIPSVANIFTSKAPPRSMRGPWDQFYFEQIPNMHALGTGFVLEAYERGGGLLLTNNHVVAGADEIKVKFTEDDDEPESPAVIVGTDPVLDVALIEVQTKRKLQAVALGDSDRLKVGEWIAAVGNPFGHGHSVSHGIVSAKARALPGAFGQFLQVDAPINPGNSGGPLVNLRGEVVGINNAIDARGPGIGFAIPINAVQSILPQLKSSGRVDRGYIGLAVAPSPGGGAPLIEELIPGQPAASAGLHKGDAIASIDGKSVSSPTDLVNAITNAPVGRMVTAEILRGGRTMHVKVLVARRPDPQFSVARE